MRTKIMLGIFLLICIALNYAIYQKEKLIADGDTVFLELAPVDPRSLMQGDYMALSYAVETQAPGNIIKQKRGMIVLHIDEHNIGTYKRLHTGEALRENEKLIGFHKRYQQIRIVPHSFFFQEGHAKFYENAKYGVFKFDGTGKKLLVGLANKDRQIINVPK